MVAIRVQTLLIMADYYWSNVDQSSHLYTFFGTPWYSVKLDTAVEGTSTLRKMAGKKNNAMAMALDMLQIESLDKCYPTNIFKKSQESCVLCYFTLNLLFKNIFHFVSLHLIVI